MPARGEVYFPKTPLPPGQPSLHPCVVLSPTNLIATQPNTPNNRFFVTVALIRGATHRSGAPVRPIMGHSIPITPTDVSALAKPSIVETHQLFAVALDDLLRLKNVGRVTGPLLDDILAGARRLLTP
jgi:hypothetical protein